MAIYRSAMGKSVDMGAIIQKNEKVRAVGNVKNLNARGDTIDAFGRVIKPVTEKINNAYGKTVGNRSANATKAPPAKPVAKAPPQAPIPPISQPVKEELTDYERELSEDLEQEDEIIEAIKAKEKK